MADVPHLAFRSPPIWEIALSAGTASPGLFNSYDVREVHDIFRDRFPNAEKQPPYIAPALGPTPVLGVPGGLMVPGGPSFQIGMPEFTRWWFVSEHGRDLIQAQENFVARNWRRLDPTDSADYPGFELLFASFKDVVGDLDNYNIRAGRPSSAPNWCELLYDNLIPMDLPDGTRMRMSEAFRPIKFEPPLRNAGLVLSWWEGIDPQEAVPNLQVTVNNVVIPQPEGRGLKSYMKLQFVARSAVTTWGAALTFMAAAHERLRSRLIELTTENCRETWGPL